MKEQELQDLQEPASWDDKRVEKRAGVKNARVVVSVAFSRRDFERVAECAEKMGMRTSEFVREAALDRALCQSLVVRLSSFSGSPGSAFFTNKPVPHTRAWGATAPLKEAEERALTA